jgi:8-oxo-dGTP diphosphatase
VSYVAVLDLADGSSLLVDHINAGLWLPPGGHVESGEHPVETAGREAREELGMWTPAEALAADPRRFDPHYQRFVAKVCR